MAVFRVMTAEKADSIFQREITCSSCLDCLDTPVVETKETNGTRDEPGNLRHSRPSTAHETTERQWVFPRRAPGVHTPGYMMPPRSRLDHVGPVPRSAAEAFEGRANPSKGGHPMCVLPSKDSSSLRAPRCSKSRRARESSITGTAPFPSVMVGRFPETPISCSTRIDPLHRLTRLHFVPGGGAVAGYFARSACHFLTSSGVFVAVYSSMRRSRASGRRVLACGGIVFSRCFIPS